MIFYLAIAMIHHLQHIVDLVEICRLKGIKQVVISPGSRNAALIKLFAQDNFFELHSIVDERSAAFYGLGISLATQQPVALLCTSGTAVLNYAPALAEAYYQRVPLIAITADRPEHLIDQQDNQTIRQVNVYQNFIKKSIHLHQPILDFDELEAQHLAIDNIINKADSGNKGPVHINVPISEPFYIELPQASKNIKISSIEEKSPNNIDQILQAWKNASKPMIICGEGGFDKRINSLLNTLSTVAVVLAEPISNIKGENIIAEIDRLMIIVEADENIALHPDLLVSFGGPIVSKRLKQWLQKQPQLKHFRISEEDDKIDTYQNLEAQIIDTKNNILTLLSNIEKEKYPIFQNQWQELYKQNSRAHSAAFENLPFSDIKAFRYITNNLPDDCILHLGNSSPVRYAQLFNLGTCSSAYSNRGVSGIDGCLSTAAGFASQSTKTNLLITGDLSFMYDSNGLWNSNLSANLKIIVINNQGGGIFRMLPGPSEMDAFEKFMETKHPLNIEKLVTAFGVEYLKCDTEQNIGEKIQQLMESKNGPSLLEIITPRLENAKVYKTYIERIKIL